MPSDALAAGVTPGRLFTVFTRLSLQGFGGVLPVAQRELVERERWVTRDQFIELLSLGQLLPGPNVVNLALILGDRFCGWRGAAAALAGLMGAPLLIALALAALYSQFATQPLVAGALRGMGVVAAGLVIGTAVKLSGALRTNVLGAPLAATFVALTVLAIGWLRWPMVWVLLGLCPAACACAWWRAGKR
jgi:chromate transporter